MITTVILFFFFQILVGPLQKNANQKNVAQQPGLNEQEALHLRPGKSTHFNGNL
jgi:hypothetical protein